MNRRNFLRLGAGAAATTAASSRVFKASVFGGSKINYSGQGTSFSGVTAALAPQPKGFDEFMVTARKRFQMAAEAETTIRSEALQDLQFYWGEQWPDHIRQDRDRGNRPCLTINKLRQKVHQITNQQRQNRLGIQVDPVGSGADKETADIIQGILRHTEVNSMADIAYDTAFEYAAIMGFGYWRIRTDYCDDISFDQDIYDEWIEDPFSVYLDPTRTKYDASDAGYAFIVVDLTPDRFAQAFPGKTMIGLEDFRSIGDHQRFWYQSGKIRVAEYYWVEQKETTLVALTNGMVIPEADLQDDDEIQLKDGHPMIRTAKTPEIWYTKVSALEELEPRRRIPGRYVPIIPVYGSEQIVDGKRMLAGIVRDAKDSQRMYNYNRSKIAEAIALAPMAPWVVAEGQIEGYEELYKQANTRAISVLSYRQVDLMGKPAPPPQRLVVEPAIEAMTVSMMQSDGDINSTTGVYPEMQGEPIRDQSGKAILARQHQGAVANANLGDNFNRSLHHAGKVKLAMIPEVYDTARVQRIVWPDGKHDLVPINQPVTANNKPVGEGPAIDVERLGMLKVFDVRTGNYDIIIGAGPSYHSRRQEFVNSVMALVQAAPQVMSVVLDLLVKHMDWPGAEEIADRLHAMLPPALQSQDDSSGTPPIPPEVAGKIQQLVSMNGMLTQQLQQATSMIEQKVIDKQFEKQLAELKGYIDIVKAEIASKTAQATTLMDGTFQATRQRIDILAQQIQPPQAMPQPGQAQQPQPQPQAA